MAINRKTFKDLNIRLDTINTLLKLDKFALKAFNWLSNDWKVSKPLVASFLLSFSNHFF